MTLRLALSPVFALPFQRSITRVQLPTTALYTQHITRSVCLALANTITIRLGAVPQVLSDLWESLLRAVPKKKTSHRKKRQRFLAGKALQDVTSLNKCSACGNVKRAHLLCPYCVEGNVARGGSSHRNGRLMYYCRDSRHVEEAECWRRGSHKGGGLGFMIPIFTYPKCIKRRLV